MRLVVGISGASGVIYGIRLLEILRDLPDVEIHLIISNGGKLNISIETNWQVRDVESLADVVYTNQNLAATLASGSFRTDGMLIVPCSMKTLSGVVHSYADSLIVRAADVVLKERRRLLIVPRESPLHAGHCRLMLEATQMGATLVPPMPAFYNDPQTIDDLVNQTVGRLLDHFDIESGLVRRWKGANPQGSLNGK